MRQLLLAAPARGVVLRVPWYVYVM
jgi:hypothetical protein